GERLQVPRVERSLHPSVELGGPAGGRPLLAEKIGGPEVVHEGSASDDQNPLVPQRRERTARGEGTPGRPAREEAQLDDGNVGLRVDPPERRPGSVIETAPRVERRVEAGGREKRSRPRGELRIAGSRVPDGVEIVGEPEEVVNRLG